MISKRKIYKLQEEVVSIAKELKEKTHDNPTVIAYFIGVIEGLRTAKARKIDELTILNDLIRLKTDELTILNDLIRLKTDESTTRVIKKAIGASKAQSCESERSDD